VFTKVGYLVFLTSLFASFYCPVEGAAYDNYGAIAYSKNTGAWGTSYNFSTRSAAESHALRRCGRGDCRIIVWFKNACGALAVGDNGAFGWGWAGSRATAEAIALTECSARARGCHVRCWACTDR
jgi:hypothetical protein